MFLLWLIVGVVANCCGKLFGLWQIGVANCLGCGKLVWQIVWVVANWCGKLSGLWQIDGVVGRGCSKLTGQWPMGVEN